MSYLADKVDYYVDKLLDFNFYISRKTVETTHIIVYMISATDWRHSVILKCSKDSIFRMNILYVDSENSYNYTENEFDELLNQIECFETQAG